AESRYLGTIPDHRVGMTILGEHTTTPVGLVTSWPESVDVDVPPIAADHQVEMEWVPELAALVTAAGLDTHFSALFDEESGSLATIVNSGSGPRFRSTRNQVDRGQLKELVRTLVAETLINEDLDPSEVGERAEAAAASISEKAGNGKQILILPADADDRLLRRINGAENLLSQPEADTWRILLGAFAARFGPIAPLTQLRKNEKDEYPSLIGKISTRLSDGRTAVSIVTLAVILIILTPILASGLRLMIVKGKFDDIDAYEASIRRTENLIEVYRSLDKQAWSMTKLLGDLSNCMPETIEVASITLNHGEPISINGLAKPAEEADGTDAVLEFAQRLRQTMLFDEVWQTIDDADGRGVREFNITAEVRNQSRAVQFSEEDDYAVSSFSERRWGPVDEDGYLVTGNGDSSTAESTRTADAGASSRGSETSEETGKTADGGTEEEKIADARSSDRGNPDRPTRTARASSSEDEGEESSSRTRSRYERGSSSTGRSEAKARGTGRPGPPPIPEPIAAEEIKAMNRAEALMNLSKVAEAKNQPGIDDAVRERLKAEFDLLMQRVRETAK
ncbi:MAG: hypothetical protein MK085_13790, partial [Phycisphaerales bacterium]|nr:hypothetical protein [Phycisphaerales bacterium]